MKAVSFKTSKADRKLLDEIAARAVKLAFKHGVALDLLDVQMDLAATHANGCRMDFAKLHSADDFNLLHDVMGIRRHLDRDTGKLLNCFLPRCHKAIPARWYRKAHPDWRERFAREHGVAR